MILRSEVCVRKDVDTFFHLGEKVTITYVEEGEEITESGIIDNIYDKEKVLELDTSKEFESIVRMVPLSAILDLEIYTP